MDPALHAEKPSSHILLVGPRGSGKTTIGHSLARVRDLPFYDTDRMVEEVIREPIASFWAREGEGSFRTLESLVLQKLFGMKSGVVSTGGGIVLSSANRELISRMGCVLYLSVSVEVLESRLSHWGNSRPRLNPQLQLSEEIRLTLRDRDPFYREIADYIVETGGLSVSQVVVQISRLLGEDFLTRAGGV
ncbi:MAG: shikimate kinase [Leptospirillum sp.]|jgi:shikimate kinase|nr:shikimate kinase [Nitrospiraceae bacterium]